MDAGTSMLRPAVSQRVAAPEGTFRRGGRVQGVIIADTGIHPLEEVIVMKSVTFDEREIQLVRAIVMDKDREEALKFVTDVIWERVMNDTEAKACGPKPV